MRFVFWQPILSIHESAHSRNLAELGHDVIVVAAQGISQARQSLGWSLPELGKAQMLVEPSADAMIKLANQDPSETLHLIVGTRGWQLGAQAFAECSKAGAHIALVQEGPDPGGIYGLGRKLIYSHERARKELHVDFLLAMGENGLHWYNSCGWPKEKLFPYAYFVETPPDESECLPADSAGSDFEIVFVGQLIRRKGVDLLLSALAQVNRSDWRLSVIGAGVEQAACQHLAQRIGIADKTRYLGALPNKQAMCLVGQSDLLVLPSRFDGWGAVINEALMRGVPVICSDRCGAAALVEGAEWRGNVVRAGSVDALARALQAAMARGKKTPAGVQRLRAWSHCIEGPAAARYLLNILQCVHAQAPRPRPPWQLT